MSVFESIKRGLEEALAYSKGQGGPVRVHQVKIPENEKYLTYKGVWMPRV